MIPDLLMRALRDERAPGDYTITTYSFNAFGVRENFWTQVGLGLEKRERAGGPTYEAMEAAKRLLELPDGPTKEQIAARPDYWMVTQVADWSGWD